MRIFHLATAADWEAARATGRYTTSTYGRTLAEEGFIHASRADQWQGVRERFYAEVTEPLVLLVVDTDRLTAPVVEEPVPDSAETFPHVYGAIEVAAVERAIPLEQALRDGVAAPASFSRVFFGEVFHQLLLASVVLLAVAAATMLGLALHDRWGPVLGALTGFAVGLLAARLLHRRREARFTG